MFLSLKYGLSLFILSLPVLCISQPLRTGSSANFWQILFVKDDLLAFGQGGLILHSPDGGATWQQRSSGISKVLTSACFPSVKTGYAVSPEGVVIKSIDKGASWARLSYGGGDALIVIFFPTEATGFIGTDNGKLLKTTDGGDTWQTVYQNSDHFFRGLYFINELDGFAIGGGGNASNGYGILLKTVDGGENWNRVSPPLRSTLNSLFYDYRPCWVRGWL